MTEREYFGGKSPTPLPWEPLPHMQEFLDNLWALGKNENYVRGVQIALAYFGQFSKGEGLKHPDEIQRHHLLRFQVYMGEQTNRSPVRVGQPLSLAYRLQLLKYIRSWVNWLVALGYVTHDPWVNIPINRPKKLPRPLDDDEIHQLFDAHTKQAFSVSPFYYHRREVILVLLYGWGLRLHELAALTKTGMDVRQDYVTSINKRSNMGTNDRKVLPYSSEMKRTVEKWMVWRAKHAVPHIDALLITKYGEPLSTNSIYKIIVELGERAGVSINPHRLRDSFATTMLDNDVEVERVMLMMGHTKREQTMAYAKVNDHRLKSSHDQAMDPVLKKLLEP